MANFFDDPGTPQNQSTGGNFFDDPPPPAEGYYGGSLHLTIRPQGTTTTTTPTPQAPAPQISTPEAIVSGVKRGATANFNDELSGVAAASGLPDTMAGISNMGAQLPIGAARLAYEHLTGQPGEATKAYNDAVDKIRQYQQQVDEQHPIASTVGQVGGALATSLLPVGVAGQGAGLAARAGIGAATGGAYGALYGAGAGTTPEDRLTQAATGGVLGAATGGIIPPVAAGIGKIGSVVSDKVGAILGHPLQALQASRNIDQTATQRAADLLRYDVENGRGGMTAPDVAAAQQSGQPVMLGDLGGPATQDAMRAAANTSPAGRAALEAATQSRFQGQAQRLSDFIKGLAPGGGNATRTQEELDAAQRAANKPAYARAYAAGDRSINSPVLENLMGSPDVVNAMRDAAQKGKSRAIAEGFGAFNTGVKVTDDGRVIFNKGPSGVPTYPNIQFWDYTYRNLRDAASAAFRAGRNDEGGTLSNLSKQLRAELDREVPEYGKARAGAAAFFGAENALEAGQKFVTMGGSLNDARVAINKMSGPERALFAEGFSSNLVDKVLKIANNRNVTIDRIFNSQDGKARIAMALGPDRAGQLEMFLRREDMMDLARKAVSGNSTTVRQLMTKALTAGGHGAVGIGIGAGVDELLNGHMNWKHALIGGVMAGTGVATGAVNAKLAQSIAEKLASDDPKVWRDVLRVAANNPAAAGAIRRGEAFLEKLAGHSAGNNAPQITAGAIPAAAQQQDQQ